MGGIYSKNRPSYPRELVDRLFDEIKYDERNARDESDVSENTVADVGSGTGIFTRLLLERGATVYAVEPNADMRAVAEKELGANKNFISVSGSADATTLAANGVRLVTAAQAFHWFDTRKFAAECGRVLTPGGMVALIWNVRDISQGIAASIETINKKYCPGYEGPSGGLDFDDETIFSDFFADRYDRVIFPNDLAYDEHHFIGRCQSSSYAPKPHDAHYAPYTDELRSLFQKHRTDATVIIPNSSYLFLGRVI